MHNKKFKNWWLSENMHNKPVNYKQERTVLIYHQIFKTGIKLNVWKGALIETISSLRSKWQRSVWKKIVRLAYYGLLA